jgi:hypothetical protein
MNDKDYSKMKYCEVISAYDDSEVLRDKINDIINSENVYEIFDIQYSSAHDGGGVVYSALLCFK